MAKQTKTRTGSSGRALGPSAPESRPSTPDERRAAREQFLLSLTEDELAALATLKPATFVRLFRLIADTWDGTPQDLAKRTTH